ncbi:adhesion G protein-coupled receptor B2-like [Ruditapes philippinarum]|uniref:adhesion G protein-coupled receptor B2-like n=1 Tax=Ruditapes philippinarum TaxID=129788 RepID=UPI00295C0181|nr:adhesion G protein-coupled receptor B2-like [Ruditapes philippinarum]
MPSPCANGGWSDWTSWSSCSATCGGGIRSQTRSCSNPSPSSYGQYCVGSNDRVESCAKNNCVHGGWSDWSNWGSCSVTCGMGLQRRTRTCSNPPPILAGNHCFGDRSETQLCMPSPCANGGWSDWTSWSSCSATCGGGIRTQTRSCSNPSPSPYGHYCVGSNDRVESCANNVCVTNYCSASPCVHGQCYDVSNDFLCYCDHGYEGRYCNISYYYCMSNPCDHGSCVSGFIDYKCNCFEGYVGRNCDLLNATDCYDILYKRLARGSGVYNVTLRRSKLVKEIYCDMETDKGGWTVFQYRFNGSVDFYRNFSDYERGFGSLDGEFWLGLENIYEMVSRGKTELRLDLTAADGTSVYETFQNFRLGEMPYYTLHIDQGVGTAGDDYGISYHNGNRFSTFDMDRDETSRNCAMTDHGGWWYNSCALANLNGEYVTPGTQRPVESQGGMVYYSFKSWESLKVSKMMFRRI